MSLLDFSLLVAVLVQVTKITDLLLRPHQQRWVQHYFENLALKLSYAQPLTWFGHLVTMPRMHLVMTLCAAAVAIAYPAYIILVYETEHELTDSWSPTLLFLIYLANTIAVNKRFGKSLTRWLFGSGEWKTFICRYVLGTLLGLGLVTFLGGLALLPIWITGSGHFQFVPTESVANALLLLLMLPTTAVYVFFAAGFVTGYLAMLVQLVLMIMRIILPVGQAIVWRIVEYNKGAWAALTLCVTFVLALVDIAAHA
jgi:hypothetical protein